jgi:voltage-gated sodium channel
VIHLARAIADHPWTERVVMGLIFLNAITLGLETSDSINAQIGPLLYAFDRTVLAVFVAELAVRMTARGWRFFTDPWSLFDLAVIGCSLLPFADNLSVLRAFRVLRVLRLITILPSLRRVVAALLGALPGMGSIILLLAVLLYVFGVMATELFGVDFPERFGTLGISIYTLFQLMTLDGWSGEIVRPVMEVFPLAWVFFLTFILATAFTLFNLFIGVVVNAMQIEHEREREEQTGRPAATLDGIMDELHALRAELAQMRANGKAE